MTFTERPIDPGMAHAIEVAEYVESWAALPTAEELAEPIIASLYALVLWFDDRAATLQFPMSQGELVEESREVVDRANEVRALVRNATISMVRAEFASTALPSIAALMRAFTDIERLEYLTTQDFTDRITDRLLAEIPANAPPLK